MISHSPYMWHRFHYARHHIHTLWPQTTVFMSSQPLYLTPCQLYLFHHIHSIDDITTICISEITDAIVHNIISIVYDMTPTVWHHNHCFHGIRFPKYHITCRISDMSSPIVVTSQTLCLWIYVTIFNTKHMMLRQYTNIYNHNLCMCICGITHTVTMV